MLQMENQRENFSNYIKDALSKPLGDCCAKLVVLFDRATIKDLHSVFTLLVESIFGSNGGPCWDLRGLTSLKSSNDYTALQHFLSPLGPMFNVIYTLLRDPLIKFKFPLSLLPIKIRQSLDASTSHPFYIDLIHIDPISNQPAFLMLNPFDYYFFHFAYHLINSAHQRYQICNDSPWTTIYYMLCCDYIIHFLPISPNQPIIPILNFYNGKNPVYTLPSYTKQNISRLLRTDVMQPNKMQAFEHHPRNEIWRSETIITIFVDTWLNNDQVINCDYFFHKALNVSLPFYKENFKVNDIPTGEYIRIVRVLVKHLHAFANSAKADDTHMGELKKIVIPYVQGKMYVFLRHLIHSWPLDGSFRLVLELWLSFIQPWRYSGADDIKWINKPEINPDLEDLNCAVMKVVDKEYMQFITENFLAYTVFLQQLIPRFIRVDLSSPKIALILYRLTKVFAQPNLVPYLCEIESNVELANTNALHSCNSNYQSIVPPLAPTTMWSLNTTRDSNTSYNPSSVWNAKPELLVTFGVPGDKWGVLIKQKILEYEGPNFVYKPTFTSNIAPELHELILHIKKSEEIADANIQYRMDELKQQEFKGIIGFIKSLFTLNEISNDEFTMEERRKVPIYLQNSLKNLFEIFKINNLQNLKEDTQSTNAFSTPTKFNNDINVLLTPERVRQRIKKLQYEGDPDLQPIRSYEVKPLVRILYQISSKLNDDFGNQIGLWYNSNGFCGKLSRQIFCAPQTIYKYDKSQSGYSPRIREHLPPRISLRFLANIQLLVYAVLLALLSKLFGYSYLTPFCIMFGVYSIYVFLKALCDRKPTNYCDLNHSSMGLNLSSNESF